MKFGLLVSKQHPSGVSMVERFREHVDQVRAAREAGFDLIVMGQHYLSTPFQELQTLPALARLAAEAGTMRVGATVLLLPLLKWNREREPGETGSRHLFSNGVERFWRCLVYPNQKLYLAIGCNPIPATDPHSSNLEVASLLGGVQERWILGSDDTHVLGHPLALPRSEATIARPAA
jgi:hypothetical protein